MARPAKGKVLRPEGQRKSYALRFSAYGKRRYLTLGKPEDGWTEQRAEEELQNVLADVRRGTWRDPKESRPVVEEPEAESTFAEFAEEWFDRHRPEWAPKTVKHYRWALDQHLLPWFAGLPLDAVTIEEIDRFKTAKLKEKRIAAAQINSVLVRLSSIMEEAVEYGRVPSNPAKGRRRRVKVRQRERTWVRPYQLPTLLEAASATLRPVLATLAGPGLRINEALALDRPDISTGTRTIHVREGKTDAAARPVVMCVGVLDVLALWLECKPECLDDPEAVFVSRPRTSATYRRRGDRGVQDGIKRTTERANVKLAQLGIEPIGNVTPHSLRRTAASLHYAAGRSPVWVARQMGHKASSMTMDFYAQAVELREQLTGAHLREFDRALAWHAIPFAEMAANGRIASASHAEVSQTALVSHEPS